MSFAPSSQPSSQPTSQPSSHPQRSDVAAGPGPTEGPVEVERGPERATPRQGVLRGDRAEARERQPRVVTPAIDVFESDEAILVVLDVPGVAAADVTVRFEKDELFVQARRRDLGPVPIEYRRVFAIPRDVDGEAIAADLSRGVLELKLPRKASARARQIPIRSA